MLTLASFKNLLGTLFKNRSDHNRQVKIQDVQNQNANANINIDQSTNKTVNLGQPADREVGSKAADQIWKAALQMKDKKPSAPTLMDIAGPNNKSIESNNHFQAALSELQAGSFDEILQIRSEAEQHKPYVSDRLWNLFHAYTILSVKPALILRDESLDAARNWPNDEIIKEILAADYMPEAIKGLREVRETPLTWCLKIVEDELLQEVRRSQE